MLPEDDSELSLRAQVAELLGEDPQAKPALKRLPLAHAVRQCPIGAILAARGRDGEPLAVATLSDGRKVVLPDNCPHDGGLLSDGFIDGDMIVCSRHNWEFDPETGECSHRKGLAIPCRPADEIAG